MEPNEALMGLIDEDTAVSLQSPVADAPVSEDEIKLLQQASSHDNYPQFARGRQCNGYFAKEQFLARVPANGDAEQCNCMAHSAVFSTQYPSDVLADLKDLIRTPPEIMSQDVHHGIAVYSSISIWGHWKLHQQGMVMM